MLYGVEKSTDLRNPDVKIKKFTSKKALKKWLENSGNYTYNDPEAARNYHRTFRYAYEFHGRMDKKHPIFKEVGTPTYPMSENLRIYYYLNEYGMELKDL
jgi:hypothetical protein